MNINVNTHFIFAIILLVLFIYKITESEHMHFPHAYYTSYVNDLEPASVRFLNDYDIKKRVPPHEQDMQTKFFVRDQSNVVFDMTSEQLNW